MTESREVTAAAAIEDRPSASLDQRAKVSRSAKELRDQVIVERYQAGESSEELGQDYGITSERVRQILQKHGVPRVGRQRRRAEST